jgi:hypothetical protein
MPERQCMCKQMGTTSWLSLWDATPLVWHLPTEHGARHPQRLLLCMSGMTRTPGYAHHEQAVQQQLGFIWSSCSASSHASPPVDGSTRLGGTGSPAASRSNGKENTRQKVLVTALQRFSGCVTEASTSTAAMPCK